jgi:riboflavin kinase / FMN adenylyltransferase
MGVDVVITQTFTPEFAKLSAWDFMRRVSRRLGLRSLWIGYDFALGHNREGDLERLSEIGEDLGYKRAGHRSGQKRRGCDLVQPDP